MDQIPRANTANTGEFESRLDSLLVSTDRLPTLPQIFWEIQAQLQNAQNSADDLAFTIENDPSITANILRLANSAYYGFSERFVSLKDAIVLVGRREIERLVSATLIIDAFGESSESMDFPGFWTHCLQVAEAAEFISTHHFATSPYQAPSEAYLAGLMHDLGKLILNQFLEDDWAAAHAYAQANVCSDAEAERLTLGIEHGEIAGRLMEIWALAPSLVTGTRWHHRVSECPPEDAASARLIAFADSLCYSYQRDELSESSIFDSHFGLDRGQVVLLTDTLDKATERAELLLN